MCAVWQVMKNIEDFESDFSTASSPCTRTVRNESPLDELGAVSLKHSVVLTMIGISFQARSLFLSLLNSITRLDSIEPAYCTTVAFRRLSGRGGNLALRNHVFSFKEAFFVGLR